MAVNCQHADLARGKQVKQNGMPLEGIKVKDSLLALLLDSVETVGCSRS